MSTPVLYSLDHGVATITLNRPQTLNALDQSTLSALREALEAAAAPSVRAVLITGAGRAFCSGADLNAVQTDSLSRQDQVIDPGAALIERYNPVILGIRQLRKPVISAVNGVAAGAGMSIALAADIVLASTSASFLQAFAKVGLVPDAGSTWFLPRLIGETNARAMTLLAAPVKAEQALRMGLVWAIYDDQALMLEANAMALRLAQQATGALALIKDALAASPQNDLATQLKLEAALQSTAGQSPDFIEGVRAFVEKRPALFSGK
jgi:2-(1,2-epoxy-1,2-dihydrophenyl)acetyl-CoA isomerase